MEVVVDNFNEDTYQEFRRSAGISGLQSFPMPLEEIFVAATGERIGGMS